jgi:hypothetical protein
MSTRPVVAAPQHRDHPRRHVQDGRVKDTGAMPSIGGDTPGRSEAERVELTYALDGLRVISMAEQYPGPYATLILADLGADVILVERPQGGDPARQFAPFFEALNRNKRSIALDLKSPEGRAAVERLVSRSDVFLEGFRPGTAKRLGLGYDTLTSINPRLVYASISGYGQDGPYRDRTGHDISYQGRLGCSFGRRGKAVRIAFRTLPQGTCPPACSRLSESSPRSWRGNATGKGRTSTSR